MKHHDISEKILPHSAGSVSEDAMAISNQVADLMRQKGEVNSNVNVIMLGFPKDDLLSFDAKAKGKLLAGEQQADDIVSYKKDADGNLIKVVDDGAYSKKGTFAKQECDTGSDGTTGSEKGFASKDEYGSWAKLPKDSGLKAQLKAGPYQNLI